MRNYKIIPKLADAFVQTYWIINSDGTITSSCIESDPEFQEWLAEGNEPLPADEPTAY